MYDPECNIPLSLSQREKEDLQNYYENELRNKDEKIMSLEAENAMLHLRLAKLMHQLKVQGDKISGLNGKIQDQLKERRQWKGSVFSLYTKFLALQDDYELLRNSVATLPSQMQQQCSSLLEVADGKYLRLQEMAADVEALQHQLSERDRLLAEISEQLSKEKCKRKLLHNAILELRGNIRVHCRVRPLTSADNVIGSDCTSMDQVVQVIDEETVGISCNRINKMFEFERVHFQSDTQETVFNEVQLLITSLFDGYNVCVMAYGQTGSGKTHTILGSYADASAKSGDEGGEGGGGEGVVPRAIREIFRVVGSRPPGIHQVEISVIEIYNNEIRDLLSSDSKLKHEVVTATDGSMCLPTVTSRVMRTESDAMELVSRGLSERCQSATHVHEHSSRSHLLVIVTLTTKVTDLTDHRHVEGDYQWENNAKGKSGPSNKRQRSQIPRFASRSLSSGATDVDKRKSGAEIYVKNKLQLIDLAGSECVGVSGVTGKHLREAVHINRSLCALADVLSALSEERSHVPYRNSRLTHLLQDTIGGDAKLLIILCVSPTRGMLTESLQSLQFGQRARQVQRGPIRKRSVSAPNSFALAAVTANARDDALSVSSLSPRPVRSRSASLRTITSEMQI